MQCLILHPIPWNNLKYNDHVITTASTSYFEWNTQPQAINIPSRLFENIIMYFREEDVFHSRVCKCVMADQRVNCISWFITLLSFSLSFFFFFFFLMSEVLRKNELFDEFEHVQFSIHKYSK